VYAVESEHHALEQVAALPAEALPYYAELMTVLETAPWGGEPYDRQRPDGNMRTYVFGKHDQGMVIYLVLEDQRRVVVLRVLWAG
jgi:plasmid stabilization system protein ParE